MTKECERYRLLTHGYLDGELTSDEEKELQEHVASCERCARAFEEMRSLTEDLNRMSLHFAEGHVWDAIRANVLPPREKKRSAYVLPGLLVATMVVYKIVDLGVGFGVAILLKPVVLAVVALLLALHKQNPFRLYKTMNAGSSPTPR